MTSAASEHAAGLLAAAPESVQIRPLGAAVPPVAARSYPGNGRVVLWAPEDPAAPGAESAHAYRYAVDAEVAARPVPPALAARFGIAAAATFWPRWTAVEVCCKLRNLPVPVWLREYGLQADPRLTVRSFALADLVVSCGVLPGDGRLRPGWSAVASVPSPC